MTAREGMIMNEPLAMSVDRALKYADDWCSLPPTAYGASERAFAALAAEVRSLREQNSRLRPSAPAFNMDAAAFAAAEKLPFVIPKESLVTALTATLPHLPVYLEFGADGKPFCRRSWNEGREAGIAAVAEAKESLQPDMEALRRDKERLDWFDANGFTAYRSIDSIDGLSKHCVVVHEKPGPRRDNVADTIREAIDAAQAGKQGGR